jgi:hypothetical protein
MEKYHNPLAAEGEYVSPVTNNVKYILKLLISVLNDKRKEIGGNSQADMVIKNITNNL